MRKQAILVWCDRCPNYVCGAKDGGDINTRLKAAGWQIENGRDLCPDCIEEARAAVATASKRKRG